jgi:hypothetical protein
MADDTLYIDMSLLLGINNVDDSWHCEKTEDGEWAVALRRAENIIITNTRRPMTRNGYDRVMAGARTHSLWSDGDICLFVEGGNLCMLNEDYSITVIRDGLMVGARMSYKKWGDRIYYSNKYQIGWIAAGPVTDIREDGSIVERDDELYSDHNIRVVDEEEVTGSSPREQIWEYPETAIITLSGSGNVG